MMTATLLVIGAVWLLALVSLVLDLAGRPWGRTSRLRSAAGLLMCTGAGIDLLVHWPGRPWTVGVFGLLFVLAGFGCVPADRRRGRGAQQQQLSTATPTHTNLSERSSSRPMILTSASASRPRQGRPGRVSLNSG